MLRDEIKELSSYEYEEIYRCLSLNKDEVDVIRTLRNVNFEKTLQLYHNTGIGCNDFYIPPISIIQTSNKCTGFTNTIHGYSEDITELVLNLVNGLRKINTK